MANSKFILFLFSGGFFGFVSHSWYRHRCLSPLPLESFELMPALPRNNVYYLCNVSLEM